MASRAKRAAEAAAKLAGGKPKAAPRGGVGSSAAAQSRLGDEIAAKMVDAGAVPEGSVLASVRDALSKRRWDDQTWEYLDQIAQDTSQVEARRLMRDYFASKDGSGWESDRLRDFDPTTRKAIAARIKQGLAEPDTAPESDPLSAVPAPPDNPKPKGERSAPTRGVSKEDAARMNRQRGESESKGLPPGLAARSEARAPDDRVQVVANPLPRERLEGYLSLRKKAREIKSPESQKKFWKENGFSPDEVATAEKQQAAINDLVVSQKRDARSPSVSFTDPDTGATRKGVLPGRTDSADQQYVRDLRAAAGFFPRSVAEQVNEILKPGDLGSGESIDSRPVTRLREPNARTAAGEGGVHHRGDMSMETRINALERMLRGGGRLPVDPVPSFSSPRELATALAKKHSDTFSDPSALDGLARTIEARYPNARWGEKASEPDTPEVPDEQSLAGAAEPITNPLPESSTPIGEPDAIAPAAGDAPPPPKSRGRGKKKPPEEEVVSTPNDDAAVADWAASQGEEPPAPAKKPTGRRRTKAEKAVPNTAGADPLAGDASGAAPPRPSPTDAMNPEALRSAVNNAARPQSSADKAGDAVRRAVDAARAAQAKADEAAAAAKKAADAVDPAATPDPAESLDATAAGDAPPAPTRSPDVDRTQGDSAPPASETNRSSRIRNLLAAGAAGGAAVALNNMGGSSPPPASPAAGDRQTGESMSDYVLRKTLYSRTPKTYGTIQHYGE